MSTHLPQRERKKRPSKKHEALEQRKMLLQGATAAREAALKEQGPLRISRAPRTEAERAALQAACRSRAALEGCRGQRRRERAEAIYAEVVAEASHLVRTVKPNQMVVIPAQRQDTAARGPGGVIVLPSVGGLIQPP